MCNYYYYNYDYTTTTSVYRPSFQHNLDKPAPER